MKLGEITDTQDACGQIISRSEKIEVEKSSIADVMKSLQGEILQQPPMYSALKHRGTPLYKLARRGIEVTRQARAVHIYNIALLNFDPPFVSFRTVCSKGTYIRTLCHDMGEKLGVGAHLFALERTAVGRFHIDDSITINELKASEKELMDRKGVFSMDDALSWLPEIKIQAATVRSIKNGAPLKAGDCPGFSPEMKKAKGIRIKSPDDDLLAVASYSSDRDLIKMDVVCASYRDKQ
jgi:tRNA pseudouridine55 synthase